jgi:Bacterial Ig-like domain (group 3)
VTYTATVNPATVTGTVAFQEAGTSLTGCSAQTINSGKATCSVTGYANWGSYNVTATYSGASNYLSSTSSTSTQTVEPPPVGPPGPFRFFSPTSFWNEELPADATLDPSSAEVVGAFNAEIAKEEEAGTPAAINTTSWSVPIYTVPADQPTVKVRVTTENIWATPALQSAWDAVPLPADAQPAAGTDKHLVVWQPSTNQLWEFWQLEDTSEGWQAGWGGAMQNASSDPGVYGPEAWPGATTGWGASASSLSIAGGLITLEDLEKGVINHALAIGIPAPRGGVYASPAQRTDGKSTDPLSLPEGAHLRLDPSLNLAALHLPRLTLMLAEAAQRYGIFVRDVTGSVSFYAQDPIPTGTEPYTGPHGYFEGKSTGQILASFPWSHLQLLKMELHSES